MRYGKNTVLAQKMSYIYVDIIFRPPVDSTFANLDSWTSVRKELRNFSEQSLRELEEERAALMSKNVILEEQLKESQDYIDKHLARYVSHYKT